MSETKPEYYASYGAFIITYERPEILLKSLEKLLEQSHPPEYLLVIDNSESRRTEELIRKLPEENIGYYRVGYNSGPAGGAKIGLEKLVGMGFKWIYWGDDDNPPIDKETLRDFFNKLEQMEDPDSVGLFGGKGGKLKRSSGRIETFSNAELASSDILEVDSLPGGATLLVNSDVVKKGILPDEKLFFGFEELDFCLRIKKAGFKLLVNTDIWLRENHQLGFREPQFRWKASHFGNPELLWRSYYSTRNLLYIYYKNGYIRAFLLLILRSLIKSVVGFGHGLRYGKRNLRIQWWALMDFTRGKFGKSQQL